MGLTSTRHCLASSRIVSLCLASYRTVLHRLPSYRIVSHRLASDRIGSERTQLNVERKAQRAFNGFEEMPIPFAPSYKYDPGTDQFDTRYAAPSPPPSPTSPNKPRHRVLTANRGMRGALCTQRKAARACMVRPHLVPQRRCHSADRLPSAHGPAHVGSQARVGLVRGDQGAGLLVPCTRRSHCSQRS